MIDFFHPTERYSHQTQRLVARAQYGAADIFEIAGLVETLTTDDLKSWKAGWMALGENAEREAAAAESAGHRTTAIERFFHASTYYQQSDIFTPSGDPSRVDPFRKSVAAFKRGAALHDPEIRVVAVPCGNDVFEGYFCLPPGRKPGARVPAVLFIGGGDAYTEETYFSGYGLLERGFAVLLLDLPGRGSSIYIKTIPARPDFEVPGGAALDWLAAQPEVDPERLAVSGISFGGYYGPRLAAFDKRVKALASWGAVTSVLDNIYEFNPRSRNNHKWLTNSPDDATTRALMGKFTVRDCAAQITCPVLITHGARDTISDPKGSLELMELMTNVRNKKLIVYEGPGAGHCGYDFWRQNVPVLFDFLLDNV
jgi:pimeloyl-ACP methyl ester carboxylesterase